MQRSRRVTRAAARLGVTATVVAVAALVASAVTPGSGRTVAAVGEAFGAGGEYHAVTPDRILDTREPAPLDVEPYGRKPASTPTSDASFELQVVGRAGLPAFVDADGDCADDNVLAVAVNITVVDPSNLGWVRVFGKGAPEGESSVLNFFKGNIAPNTAVLRPGCDGKVTIRPFIADASGDLHLLVDVFGWFSSSGYSQRGARLEPAGPGRIFDSREAAFGDAPLGPGQQRRFQIRGVDAWAPAITDVVPDDASVVGVMVNITGVNNTPGSQPTFLAVVPDPIPAGEFPATSNLNLRKGQIRSNLAIVPLAQDGSIVVYNRAGDTDFILDVMGYFVEGRDVNSRRGRVVPLVSPFRAFDTREPEHFDQPLPPAKAEDWSFTDFVNDVKVDGEPVGDQLGLIGNLTLAGVARQYSWSAVSSFITAYPTPTSGASRTPPEISNMTIAEGEILPNLVLLDYGSDGTDPYQVTFYNRAGYLDYLLDVTAVVLDD